MSQITYFLIFICAIAPFLVIEKCWGLMPSECGVVPGDRVVNILIGEIPPKGRTCDESKEGIKIICEKGNVKEINIASFKYCVEKSKLRVGDNISDIVRFYGKGETEIVNGRILVKYPNLGIDFETGKTEQRIIRIKIYRSKTIDPAINIEDLKKQFIK